MTRLSLLAASALVLGLGACARVDRAAGTDTSGRYPNQADGTRNNPPGTAVERAYDRAAGTNTSGAYPSQSDGTRNNPPGTAVSRAYDRATGSNTTGTNPNGVRNY